jgi:hypothetical protein
MVDQWLAHGDIFISVNKASLAPAVSLPSHTCGLSAKTSEPCGPAVLYRCSPPSLLVILSMILEDLRSPPGQLSSPRSF